MADAVGAPPAANEEILEQLPAIPPPSMTPSVPVMTDVPSVGSGPSGAAAAAPADPPAYSGVAVAGVDAQRAPRLALRRREGPGEMRSDSSLCQPKA